MDSQARSAVLASVILALVWAGLVGCGRATGPDLSSPPDASTPAVETARLTVEEYPIVEDSVDQPTHFEFMDRVDPQIREKRKAVREAGGQPDVARMNATLERFGYQLRIQDQPGDPAPTPGRYGLYQGENLILNGIRGDELSPVFVNAAGTDWFFCGYADGQGALMVRSGTVLSWPVDLYAWMQPDYLGDDLVWVEFTDGARGFRVVKEGQTLYEGHLPEPGVDLPFKWFGAWDGHWAAEVAGDVILDGQSLRAANGYDEAFHFRLIKDRPFYFYAEGGEVHMSYGGETLANSYDEVIHYRCCEPAAFNPGANDSMVWFWARKGTMWHYVEAGIYE